MEAPQVTPHKTPTPPMAVVCQEVGKSYGRVQAVDSVSWQIAPRTIAGLIGPDGAGKTTLIKMMATLISPTHGSINILGYDVAKEYSALRKTIGYVPSRFSLYPDLTIRENIQFFASIYKKDCQQRLQDLSDIYSLLAPFEKRKAGQLSGGMKQKLSLCCALIHTPRILLLDEPTTGVDPVSRKEFWQILQRLVTQEDITIVVSTPYMDEAERCHSIALMNEGKILSIASPQEIKASYSDKLFEVKSQHIASLLPLLRKDPHVIRAYSFGDSIHCNFSSDTDLETFRQTTSQVAHQELTITPTLPSIEDCFLKILHP